MPVQTVLPLNLIRWVHRYPNAQHELVHGSPWNMIAHVRNKLYQPDPYRAWWWLLQLYNRRRLVQILTDTSSQFCTRCTLLQQREYNAHSYKHSPQDVKSTVHSHISWHVLHVQWIHKPKDWPEGSVGNGCEWHTKSPITMLIACWFVSSSVWTCEVNQYNVNARKLPILLLSCLWSNTAVPVVSLPVPAVVGTTAERMHVTVHAVDKWNVMILQLSKILYLPLLQ